LPDSTLQQAEVFASSLNAMWQKNIHRDESLILLEQSVNVFNIVHGNVFSNGSKFVCQWQGCASSWTRKSVTDLLELLQGN
jgi:hypothetical protein